MNPYMEITPAIALLDEVLSIKLGGLEPDEIVTIQASLTDIQKTRWVSSAIFRAGKDGTLDLAETPPLEGDYYWPDTMGLVWSLKPVPQSLYQIGYEAFDIKPYTLQFTMIRKSGRTITKEVERICIKEGVSCEAIRENGLFGTLFLPGGTGPHSAIMLLNGSDGGLNEPLAALYASHGYATLALAFFNYESLPPILANIPLEYFGKAIAFLQSHPKVNSEKIGVSGISYGGMLSLLLGATFPQLKAVVAYVPSSVLFGAIGADYSKPIPSFTSGGKPIPFIPYSRFTSILTKISGSRIGGKLVRTVTKIRPIALTPMYLSAMRHNDAELLEKGRIKVENTNGAILMISGADDQMWPSKLLSEQAVERLKSRDFKYPYKHLSYPNCGHVIWVPYGPLPPTHTVHPVDHNSYIFGGNPKDNAFAMVDAWPQVLEFLEKNLK